MSPIMIVITFLIVFIVAAIVLRMPISFSMGATAITMFAILGLSKSFIGQALYLSLDNFAFLAVPFFVFAGGLMQYSGISHSLINLIDSIAGRVRASLGTVTVLSSMAFGLLTGSNLATLSTIGSIMIPEMKKKGYKSSYSGALAAACSFLGTFIPPSVPGIMYAITAGEKVSEVWLSTVVPGIMFGLSYIIYNTGTQWNTEKKTHIDNVTFGKYFNRVGKQTVMSFPALLMPIIIFGGIYGGIFTATEAGAVSVCYGIAFYLIKKHMKHKEEINKSLWNIAKDSMSTTAMICCMLAFARAAGYTFTLSGVSNELAEFLTNNISNKYIFLIIANIIFLIQGTFIDLNSGILIMTPLLLPTVVKFGIDPIHFGAIMLTNLSIGTLTPPLATALYLGTKLAEADTFETIKEIMPFVVIGIINVLFITFIPELSLVFKIFN